MKEITHIIDNDDFAPVQFTWMDDVKGLDLSQRGGAQLISFTEQGARQLYSHLRDMFGGEEQLPNRQKDDFGSIYNRDH